MEFILRLSSHACGHGERGTQLGRGEFYQNLSSVPERNLMSVSTKKQDIAEFQSCLLCFSGIYSIVQKQTEALSTYFFLLSLPTFLGVLTKPKGYLF